MALGSPLTHTVNDTRASTLFQSAVIVFLFFQKILGPSFEWIRCVGTSVRFLLSGNHVVKNGLCLNMRPWAKSFELLPWAIVESEQHKDPLY